MVNIGIDTRPEPFEPNEEHQENYDDYRQAARKAGHFGTNDSAVATAILALAAQMARIADAYEYQVMNGSSS